MATLEQRLTSLTQAIGQDIGAIYSTRGNLSTLTTSEKTNLVGAINELKAAISGAGANINDSAASTASVYSSQKTVDLISALKSDLLGADVSAAYDTFKELQDWIQANAASAAGLVTAVGNKVDYSQAQSLTSPQKIQARANISAYGAEEIGNPDTDFVTVYNTAKA